MTNQTATKRAKVRKAVFPVGGMGTRFLPATKSMPKEMMPVVDKPLIQYAFEEAMDAGIEQFIFVTGRNKYAISNHFDHSYELQDQLQEKNKNELLKLTSDWLPDAGTIFLTRQQVPLGLGHAVWCARNFVGNEPFAVLLADDLILAGKPCLKQMLEMYEETGGNIVAVETVAREETGKYGILDVAAQKGRVIEARGLVEKPKPEVAPSDKAIIGRYILQPEVFGYLDKKVAGAGGEIQLTDALMACLKEVPVHGYCFEGQRFDCGSKHGFLEANVAFALAREDLKSHMEDILERYGALMSEAWQKKTVA